HGGSVLIAGEAGVGKSRLVDELLRGLDPGVLVLTGNCLDLSSEEIPLLPVMGWLRRAVSVLGAESVAEAAGPFCGELARLEPSLGEPDTTSQDKYRLLAGCRFLLRRLSEQRPTVVVIEDVHWADAITVQLMQFLAVEMRDTTSLGIATVRTDEPSDELAAATVAGRIPGVARLDLARLDLDDATSLAAGLLDDDSEDGRLAQEVAQRSEGNPFFLEELAMADGHGLSETLQGLLLARMTALEPRVTALVELAAVGDPPIRFEQWASAAEMIPDALDDVLTAARAGGVLVTDGESHVTFRHSLVRDAVLANLLPGRAAALHRCWADSLETDAVVSAEAALASARHWYATTDLTRVWQSSLRAADAAKSLHAYGLQAELLDRALDFWGRADEGRTAGVDRIQVLRASARAHMMNARHVTADERLDEALAVVDVDSDPATASEILSDRGELEMYGSEVDPRPSYRAALEVLGDTGFPGPRARALAAWADYATMTSVPHQVYPEADRAVRLAQEAGERATEALALRGRAMAEAFDDPERSIEDHRACLVAALESGANNVLVAGMSSLLLVLGVCLGRDQQAFDEGSGFIDAAEQMGLRGHPVFSFIHQCVGEALVNLGRLGEAEDHFVHVLSQHCPYGLRLRAQSLMTQIALIRGQEDLARARYADLSSSSHDAPQSASPMWLIPVARQRAGLAWADEGPAAAWTVMEPWLRNGVEHGGGLSLFQDVDLVLGSLRAAALAGHLDDPASPEVALVEQVRTLAHAQMARMPHPHVLNAYLARVTGDDPAIAWRAAVSVFDQIDGPAYWRIDARMRLAENTPDRAEALECVDRAQAEATRLGSRAQLEDIAVVRHRVDGAPMPGGVTARELEVLQLVDQGLTNQQIADRLVISRSTAGVHLSHILDKLGVADRGAAATWAREHGLIARSGR
ncbi:MAG: AAA family ATPase, partial [Jiangellales bacterium]